MDDEGRETFYLGHNSVYGEERRCSSVTPSLCMKHLLLLLVMCLSTNGERACTQMKHFKIIYQSFLKV